MVFKVLSRSGAIAYSYKQNIPKTEIISISDAYDSYPHFNDNQKFSRILYLKFDDVEKGEPNCITTEDAKKIVKFINTVNKDIEQIIVHCGAGVSRSAGVCAAIMKYLTGDDSEIFDNPKYCPNMTCYRTVLNGFYSLKEEV